LGKSFDKGYQMTEGRKAKKNEGEKEGEKSIIASLN
jgi:hypothetical protein